MFDGLQSFHHRLTCELVSILWTRILLWSKRERMLRHLVLVVSKLLQLMIGTRISSCTRFGYWNECETDETLSSTPRIQCALLVVDIPADGLEMDDGLGLLYCFTTVARLTALHPPQSHNRTKPEVSTVWRVESASCHSTVARTRARVILSTFWILPARHPSCHQSALAIFCGEY